MLLTMIASAGIAPLPEKTSDATLIVVVPFPVAFKETTPAFALFAVASA